MKSLVQVIILSALIAVAHCRIDSRIIGGQAATDGQFPYQVSLRRSGYHECGGCILNEYWILTAAHCLFMQGSKNLVVVTGTNSLSKGGDEYLSTKVIFHENFEKHQIHNDVGLVKVARPIQFREKVKPIELNGEAIGVDENLTLSGWGLLSYPGRNPDKLQYVELKSIDNRVCEKELDSRDIIESQICTFTRFGQGACQGDSGGPLVFKGKVAGIVSWGRPCAVGAPDVFTRVSEFKKWIENTMASN